ncbi:pyruvate dehydrogenase [Roseivivax halodurans JCM 10272]|uniref:Pyruvate dehydrogenase n=1 Tax=Roseivivax halodurans JCM 10272 TaxID=1449350 RepID=X7ECZ3_9RHOB|nr:biotin/lipoyl-containing protein [Roseivivax halodurans]ETX13924.1 pyruvate dehydrogenase [Roseivivax halodurans JCM 10272]
MPHEVTMPQLGMAQDAGRLVAWLKAPGDAVRKGEALFEVETDKATMEVEAQGDGFLTGVVAAEGDDVPVGQVIAKISESADDVEAAPAAPAAAEASAEAPGGDALPEGRAVTMPQLGMAQDAGLLVGWSVALGDKVGADDPLFEVETDKSAMEVPAGVDGYLAATLAEAGEEVPTGEAVAIISPEPPASPVARSRAEAGGAPEPAAEAPAPTPETTKAPAKAKAAPAPAPAPAQSGRILASPKARRLALEQGLDLSRLAEAGHPQPYHVADLETLRAMPAAQAGADAAPAAATQRLVAETESDGLPGFVAWAAGAHGLDDPDAIVAGLAGASLDAEETRIVAIERFGATRAFAVHPGRRLGQVEAADGVPHLVIRDLRGKAIRGVELGSGSAPVLTLMPRGAGLTITLEAAPGQLDAQAAIRLLTEFAGRAEDPLRHLL